MNDWTKNDAIDLCKKIEAISPRFGAHVALTGGVLYKEGDRKDLDILFFEHTGQVIDKIRLFEALQNEVGFSIGKQFSRICKAMYNGKNVDIFLSQIEIQSFGESGGEYANR